MGQVQPNRLKGQLQGGGTCSGKQARGGGNDMGGIMLFGYVDVYVLKDDRNGGMDLNSNPIRKPVAHF